MALFRNGTGARLEERLATVIKGIERLAAEQTRRADHAEGDVKALETGLRADLQAMGATLTRIEGLLRARNGNGRTAAAAKKAAPPLAYASGGGILWAIVERLLS